VQLETTANDVKIVSS